MKKRQKKRQNLRVSRRPSDKCKAHEERRARVAGSLDVFGLAVKSVAVGLAWTAVSHGAVLSEGKRFIFSILTLSNFSSVRGTFVLLLQFFQSEIEGCVKFSRPAPSLPSPTVPVSLPPRLIFFLFPTLPSI